MPPTSARSIRRHALALAASGLVVVGCGDDDFANGSRTTIVDDREVFVAESPPCDDHNACVELFVIDGVSYVRQGDCAPEPPAAGALTAVGRPGLAIDQFFDGADGALVGRDADTGAECPWLALQRHVPQPGEEGPALVLAAESPLSPRQWATAVAVGSEVLVVGGDSARPCPPGADCAVAPIPLADAAIFDPASGTWRRAADAPFPILFPSTAVVGQVVYLWEPDAVPGGALLSYDVGDDRWDQLPRPEELWFGDELVASPDTLFLSNRHDSGTSPVLFYDPSSRAWRTLPDAPLPPLTEQSLLWSGTELVLIGAEADAHPNAEPWPVLLAASYDPGSGKWRRLPDSPIVSGHGQEWVGESGFVVSPTPGTVINHEAGDDRNEAPLGGILDLEAATWEPLPPLPRAEPDAMPRDVGLGRWPVGGDGYVTESSGHLLDIRSRGWVRITLHDEQTGLPTDGATSAWAAGRLVVFGGVTWEGPDGTLSNRTWTWHPALR